MKVRELGRFIRDQRNSARLSLRKLSSLTGVSNPYLSQIERGLRRPSADILQAIAKALRISAETLYVQAGILDERSDADPVGEIRRDNALSDRQKQILVDLYQSFREGNPDEASKAVSRVRAAAPRSRATKRPAAKSRPAKRSPKGAPVKRPAGRAAPVKRMLAKRAPAKKASTRRPSASKRVAAARRPARSPAKTRARRAPRRRAR